MKELNLIQTSLKAPKSQFNHYGNYSYRSAEDILEALKPLLKETGCTVTLEDEVEMIGSRYYVVATATLKNAKGECETTTAWAREEETKKGMDGCQITGSASSYARKYALNGLFAIDDNKDSDFDSEVAADAERLRKCSTADEGNSLWKELRAKYHEKPELFKEGGVFFNVVQEKKKGNDK